MAAFGPGISGNLGTLVCHFHHITSTGAVEISWPEVRNLRFSRDGGALGDDLLPEVLLQPLDGHGGCMSDILLYPMPVDRVSIFLLKCVSELFSAPDSSVPPPQ